MSKKVYSLMSELITQDPFFQELLKDGTIELKSAKTRKSFRVNLYDKPVGSNGKTFRDWVDEIRLPDSTGYEKALIWLDHDETLNSGNLRLTGKSLDQYISTTYLTIGNISHHRTQHCYIIPWSKLQLMSDTELKYVISGWILYMRDFFHVN